MRLRQLRILRYNHYTLSVDDRPCKYHPILTIVYGYSTQSKPSLGYVILSYEILMSINIST